MQFNNQKASLTLVKNEMLLVESVAMQALLVSRSCSISTDPISTASSTLAQGDMMLVGSVYAQALPVSRNAVHLLAQRTKQQVFDEMIRSGNHANAAKPDDFIMWDGAQS